MITVVIPYLHSDAVWNELILTVRSIEKYFAEEHRIILVGDKHPKLNLPVIECELVKGFSFAKCADSINKMRCICESNEISEEFLYWYDDIVLLKDLWLNFFETQYCLLDMATYHNWGNSHYDQLKISTYTFLREQRLHQYNFETHLPKLFNKSKMRFMLDNLVKDNKKLLLNSLYNNFYYPGKPIELRLDDMIKGGFYGVSSPYSFGNINNFQEVLSSKLFLNYNNRGLSDGLKKYIISRFPNKCSYER